MSRTLRRRSNWFWDNAFKKVHRDRGGVNPYGPSFYKHWFTKSNRLDWRKLLKNKDFDFDDFVAPIRELGYWW